MDEAFLPILGDDLSGLGVMLAAVATLVLSHLANFQQIRIN